jgi:hypothetical protein
MKFPAFLYFTSGKYHRSYGKIRHIIDSLTGFGRATVQYSNLKASSEGKALVASFLVQKEKKRGRCLGRQREGRVGGASFMVPFLT